MVIPILTDFHQLTLAEKDSSSSGTTDSCYVLSFDFEMGWCLLCL